MPLSDQDRKNIDSWFAPSTREAEVLWIERLNEVTSLYQEHGFTKGEGAMLYMLNSILTQVNCIKFIVQKWDEEED